MRHDPDLATPTAPRTRFRQSWPGSRRGPLALICLAAGLISCQNSALPPLRAAAPGSVQPLPVSVQRNSAALSFPADWQGIWSGRCTNTGPAGKQTYAPVEMRLTIQPRAPKAGQAAQSGPSSWQWKIEYRGGGQDQVRNYTLLPVDAAKGQWLIDEHNGILLDNFAVNGQLLIEQFSVGATVIFGRHQLLGPTSLKVELVSFSLQSPRQSGTQEYPVSSFKLLSVQDCPLKKD